MSAGRSETVWDEAYGIPYIYADDWAGLAYEFGRAQMRNHGNLLLALYAQARGRGAEHFGQLSDPGPNALTKNPEGVNFLQSDVFVRSMNIPALGEQWYADETEEARAIADAFARGINDFAGEFPDHLAPEVRPVLPVSGIDVMRHMANAMMSFQFNARRGLIADWMQRPGTDIPGPVAGAGSNAWAVGPTKSTSGNPMLLCNPHLQWNLDLSTFMEAQLVIPNDARALDEMTFMFHGVALLGLPVLSMGCNRYVGWANTVNPQISVTLYGLALDGEDGYTFDGARRAFDVTTEIIKVRQEDGIVGELPIPVRRSPDHGGAPVLLTKGETGLAVHVAAPERGRVCSQSLAMMRAGTLAEFEAALAQMQLPMFNVLYAGRDRATGEPHLLYLFASHTPRRTAGDYAWWWDVVPGDTAATQAGEIHAYEDLPRIVDPPSGWLQNTNDGPFTATLPAALDPKDVPAYMAPNFMNLRAHRSVKLLTEAETHSFEEFIARKHSTRVEMADRVMEDLLAAAAARGTDRAREAARVLDGWDRHMDAGSVGAVLFLYWLLAMETDDHLATGLWAEDYSLASIASPTKWRTTLDTPRGLADPVRAAAALDSAAGKALDAHGRLDIAWGEVIRYQVGEYDLPANGGPGDPMGLFRAIPLPPALRPRIDGGPTPAHRIENEGGEGFVMAVEFTPTGPRAAACLPYGNASQPGSPHIGDQLPLMAEKRLRPIDFTFRGPTES